MDEKLSIYDRLIAFINSNVPLLGETFPVLGVEMTATHVIVPVVFLFLINLLGNLIRSLLINKILGRYVDDRKTILSIGNTTKYAILVVGLAIILYSIGLKALNFTINEGADHPIEFFDILRVIFFLTLLVFFSGKLKSIFVKQILSRYSDDIGVSQSIGTIIQYIVIFIGGLIIVQSTINLGSLNVLAVHWVWVLVLGFRILPTTLSQDLSYFLKGQSKSGTE